MIYDVIVIGGGSAGIFASIFAGNRGKKVLLLEKMEKLGKKLLIAGQGQCNLTHTGTKEDFIDKFGDNGNFLKKALYRYPPQAMIKYFEDKGLPLVATEKGKYFPKTLKSLDVLDLLKRELQKNKVEIRCNSKVISISKNEFFEIETENNSYRSKNLIIATGGKSYDLTGSSGDGYKFCKKLGLKVIEPRPALTPCYVKDYAYVDLSGVSFRDVILELWRENKKAKEFTGDLLFTHKNLSGPVIIDSSRYFKKDDILRINFTGENREIFEKEFRIKLNQVGNKLVKNSFDNPNLSDRFIKKVFEEIGISEELKCAEIKKEQIKGLLTALTYHEYEVQKLEGFNLAMVTAGGISLDDINKNTMESKKIKGLFVVGELLDIDGDTGGYNIQATFSTGALAAESL